MSDPVSDPVSEITECRACFAAKNTCGTIANNGFKKKTSLKMHIVHHDELFQNCNFCEYI